MKNLQAGQCFYCNNDEDSDPVVVGAKVLGPDCLTPDAQLGGLGQMTDLWLGLPICASLKCCCED